MRTKSAVRVFEKIAYTVSFLFKVIEESADVAFLSVFHHTKIYQFPLDAGYVLVERVTTVHFVSVFGLGDTEVVPPFSEALKVKVKVEGEFLRQRTENP